MAAGAVPEPLGGEYSQPRMQYLGRMTTAASIPAVFLMGPTASGKTGLSLALHAAVAAGRLPFEGVRLISVDSAQVFRGMDIGTAKPGPEVLAAIPHALVSILDAAESYSAARFVADATALVAEARAKGELPVLVGGTGLYFRALAEGLSDLPVASPAVRARLEAEAAALGWPALHARLAQFDAQSAALIQPNDPQRITRALEIYELTGTSRSQHWAAPKQGALAGPVLKVALMPPSRADLHAAIETRFLQMMEDGLLAEVRALKARGDLSLALPSMRSVGYRQLWEHLDGLDGLDAAVQRAIIATRQYAKRQITWLNSEPDLNWINPRKPEALQSLLELIPGAVKM